MITRPLARYYGAKFRLAPWVIQHFPKHTCYTETYGGMLGVFLRKPKSRVEVVNDLNGEIVNLYKVLRSECDTKELCRLLRLTPYSRQEWEYCYELSNDPVEQARRTLLLATMSYNPIDALGRNPSGFRVSSSGSHNLPEELCGLVENLPAINARMKGIVVECRDALECMQHYDRPTTLHYVDPPYLGEVRSRTKKSSYMVEAISEDEHKEILRVVNDLSGMVVLSGYPSQLYHDSLPGWTRVEKRSNTNSATPGLSCRVEALWLNPAASKAARVKTLF